MRTLHEQIEGSDGESLTPIRLSYHGSSHYNAVISLSWKESDSLIKTKPGEVEAEAIQLSVQSTKVQKDESKAMLQKAMTGD